MTQHPRSLSLDVPGPPRRLVLVLVGLITVSLVLAWGGVRPEAAQAATVAINQCNFDETGAAREIDCDVTVVNTLDIATGITSSTVTTTVCAGPPGEAACVTTTGDATTDIVGSVNQCNNSVNAGGSIVTCTVNIVNNITGVGSTSPATVNQCIGSGEGGGTEPTTDCAPVSSTSGADIIQCNTAGNGGGASERVECTVLTSTVSSLWPVTIVQCNDSANGGGDLVTCTSQITTNLLAPAVETTTTTAPVVTTTVPVATTTTLTVGTTTTLPDDSVNRVQVTSTTVDTATTTTGNPATTSTTTSAGATTTTTDSDTFVSDLPETGGAPGGTFLVGVLALVFGSLALVATRHRSE